LGFFLTQKAKTDLKNIGRYTQKEWSIEQRDFYLTLLDNTFNTLAEFPDKGRKCDDIRVGYRKFRVGKHIIFYRVLESNDIEIVRILHERMDFESYF
jgi:toxin ParE1/3/4